MPVPDGMLRLNPPEAGPKLVLFDEPEPKGQTVMMGKAWAVAGAEAGAGFVGFGLGCSRGRGRGRVCGVRLGL